MELSMRSAATIGRHGLAVLCAAVVLSTAAPPAVTAARTRVIVRIAAGHSSTELLPLVERMGGTAGPVLDIINAQIVELPSASIATLARHPLIDGLSLDRTVAGSMERTSATIGASAVRENLGYDGAGVGVAIIDSGVTPWHDDLASGDGGQRIARFVDILRNRPGPYDDYGHGTHVAGIIAGDGFDSGGARTGVAPGARLTILKVLDDQGNGRISDVIAAFDYILKNRAALNIRVVNLSVATGVHESYATDPLTLAAKRLVDAGIVVVAAAGNLGRTADGLDAYGGITAPGNAPWVLTVGASNHMGSSERSDDRMAIFSSRGPTAEDFSAKPDLVAPGVGIESLSNPDSTFYRVLSPYLLDGTVPTVFEPDGDQHGRAGGDWHDRVDAAGESGADAERRESHPSIHVGDLSGIRPVNAGCGIPERRRRRGAVPRLQRSHRRVVGVRTHVVEPPCHLGQSAHHQRAPDPRRQRVGSRCDLGRRKHNVQRWRDAKRRLGQAVWW
jgi:serine protease AprX